MGIAKTKHMAVGREATESDKAPITVMGGEIEAVEEFPYLGSVISTSGTIDADVEAGIPRHHVLLRPSASQCFWTRI